MRSGPAGPRGWSCWLPMTQKLVYENSVLLPLPGDHLGWCEAKMLNTVPGRKGNRQVWSSSSTAHAGPLLMSSHSFGLPTDQGHSPVQRSPRSRPGSELVWAVCESGNVTNTSARGQQAGSPPNVTTCSVGIGSGVWITCKGKTVRQRWAVSTAGSPEFTWFSSHAVMMVFMFSPEESNYMCLMGRGKSNTPVMQEGRQTI